MKLKDLRIKAVLSQEDLGKMAGMSTATINRLELGKQKPRFVTIRKLAKALGVEPGKIEF
jgi:transcriptional regulator with XRE-family HTH domain